MNFGSSYLIPEDLIQKCCGSNTTWEPVVKISSHRLVLALLLHFAIFRGYIVNLVAWVKTLTYRITSSFEVLTGARCRELPIRKPFAFLNISWLLVSQWDKTPKQGLTHHELQWQGNYLPTRIYTRCPRYHLQSWYYTCTQRCVWLSTHLCGHVRCRDWVWYLGQRVCICVDRSILRGELPFRTSSWFCNSNLSLFEVSAGPECMLSEYHDKDGRKLKAGRYICRIGRLSSLKHLR